MMRRLAESQPSHAIDVRRKRPGPGIVRSSNVKRAVEYHATPVTTHINSDNAAATVNRRRFTPASYRPRMEMPLANV